MGDPKTDPGTQGTVENGQSVNILVAGPDLTFAKAVQAACQAIAADNPAKSYKVFPGTTKEKVLEMIEKTTFHSVIIEEEFIADTTPDLFYKSLNDALRKRPENAATAMVLARSKTTPDQTRALVRGGWRDVIVKPIDSSLFVQKMNLYHPEIKLLAEPILFSMDAERDIEVGLTFKTRTISEYGAKVDANLALAAGTVVGVHSAFLGDDLSAVVLDCVQVGDVYKLNLMFIGITPAETQSIRKMIRQEYAEEKQAA